MDVADLREFYASPLGQATRRLIAHRLMGRWPNLRGQRLLGFGYATPYLDSLGREASHLLAFMPARLGVIRWPPQGPARTALVDEGQLPLRDGSIDFALVIHGLEFAEESPALLNELFRVLAPQGRALFIVPNRRGLWARFDSTPFGNGRPFSKSQLSGLLREAGFSPVGWAQCLFMPPIAREPFLRLAPLFERAGLALGSGFSGLLIAEAVKQVYALPPGKRARRLLPRIKPVLNPAPAMRKASG